MQRQDSRTGSGGSSRPHTGYGKTRTTDGMVNGGGKMSDLILASITKRHIKIQAPNYRNNQLYYYFLSFRIVIPSDQANDF